MATYTKNTKENIDFPKANLWFLKTIKDKLEAKKWNREVSTNNEIVVLISDEYQYCHDTVSLMIKTFSDDRWEFKMSKYEIQNNPSSFSKKPKWYIYTWRMNKR